MSKVYYTKDPSKVRGLAPLIEELPSLAAVGKLVGICQPVPLHQQSDVDAEDVVLLASIVAGKTIWSIHTH